MHGSLLKISLFSASLLLLSIAGCAARGRCPDGPAPDARRSGPGAPPPRDPAFTKAFDGCLAEQGAGAAAAAGEQGGSDRPRFDRQALDACLKGKGVEPPAPPPRPREQG